MESIGPLLEMNSIVYRSWHEGFRFSNCRLPHLTLFQGGLTEDQIGELIQYDLEHFEFMPSQFGLDDGCLDLEGLEFHPYRDEIVIQMLNLHCPTALRQTQLSILDLFDRYQGLPKPKNQAAFLEFYDLNVIPEARQWVVDYSEKRRTHGFSPHITLGFGKEETRSDLLRHLQDLQLKKIRFERISLGQMGNFCTFTDNSFWERRL